MAYICTVNLFGMLFQDPSKAYKTLMAPILILFFIAYLALMSLKEDLKYDNSPLSYLFVFYTFIKSINSIIPRNGDTLYD